MRCLASAVGSAYERQHEQYGSRCLRLCERVLRRVSSFETSNTERRGPTARSQAAIRNNARPKSSGAAHGQAHHTSPRTSGYVDGQWVGEPKLPVTNKATGDIMARVPEFGEARDARSHRRRQDRAFPKWSKMLAKDRSKLVRRW